MAREAVASNRIESRAPLRWAGSKRKLLPTLRKYWQTSSKRYVEAFAGSAALFFSLRPEKALLNDTNKELVHALSVLRECPRLLHSSLADLRPSSETYYSLRAAPIENMCAFDRAVRFFYLNRYCFNGIYRTNKRGEFNVPFAPNKSGGFPTEAEWVATSVLLRQAEFFTNDFESFLLDNVKRNDFVYLDPPYAVSNRRIFSQYSAQTFGIEDIRRLSTMLREIDRRGATFVVSYAQSPEAEILANGWNVRKLYAQRNVAGFVQHRRRALEVIISNRLPLA